MLAVVRDSMLEGARVFLQSQARYSSDIRSLFSNCVWISLQAGDDSAEMHQRLKDLGVPIPTGPDAAPSLPAAPMPMGNIIPAPGGPMMGMGQPYPLMPQITVGPTEFLSVNGMVTPDVLVDDEEYREV